ncbi:MarR family transcriptional regulator [Herbiconiux sp. KACC 21604]|uniref:MarR family winged helix-turn-helix transcriptional regulator n=1 Tax=unclassified Herbiconiux TaxID=2618217 RepID=UPI0014928B11|nr:MarR family transcriptional regulator [Herbiconiux sp. SALV-R1]QJU52773.1 MarR family transcriptional regulator [Herbiconiux sp. SALV-R1]WPO87679.1 MarR family transcriptional regulator [Herbiconiux sp. KACC 21604]
MENSRPAHRRPSPTPHDLRVWRDFVETGARIRSLLGARLQAESGVSAGDYSVMLALSEAPGKRMRSSELAETVGWERSRLSHHLGRMEKRGLVSRAPSAADSRGAEVTLTAEGASRFRVASVAHLRAVQELFVEAFEPPSEADLDAVEATTLALRRHLDKI